MWNHEPNSECCWGAAGAGAVSALMWRRLCLTRRRPARFRFFLEPGAGPSGEEMPSTAFAISSPACVCAKQVYVPASAAFSSVSVRRAPMTWKERGNEAHEAHRGE